MHSLTSRIVGPAVAVMGLLLSAAGASAVTVTYGTDYQSFSGVLVVLDNPTSAGCQAIGINYGQQYRASYRFSHTTPSVLSDALVLFPGGDNAAKMLSQASNGSLNGSAVTIIWEFINHKGDSNADAFSSTSSLTIASGSSTPVTVGSGSVKISGAINGFLANQSCNVANVHAVLVSIPN